MEQMISSLNFDWQVCVCVGGGGGGGGGLERERDTYLNKVCMLLLVQLLP